MLDLEILIFTTDKTIEILYVTLPKVIEHFLSLGLKINVVSNQYNDIDKEFPSVNFIFTDIPFNEDGSHFNRMLSIACNTINSKYLLFLVDDYIFNSRVKKDNFEKIFNLIFSENIDYFSFQSVFGVLNLFNKWENYNFDKLKYDLENVELKIIDGKFKHCLSVQPSIWKVEFIEELLRDNPTITLSKLDNRILSKTNNVLVSDLTYSDDFYSFYDKKLLSYYCGKLCNHIDEREINSDFFIFDYGEIVRHGKLIESDTNSKKIVMDELQHNESLKNKIIKFL